MDYSDNVSILFLGLDSVNYYLAKVGFIFAHSQHSHISAFNNFLIICAIKLFFANSNQRHHCQPTKKKKQSIKLGKYCFNVIFTC